MAIAVLATPPEEMCSVNLSRVIHLDGRRGASQASFIFTRPCIFDA